MLFISAYLKKIFSLYFLALMSLIKNFIAKDILKNNFFIKRHGKKIWRRKFVLKEKLTEDIRRKRLKPQILAVGIMFRANM